MLKDRATGMAREWGNDTFSTPLTAGFQTSEKRIETNKGAPENSKLKPKLIHQED